MGPRARAASDPLSHRSAAGKNKLFSYQKQKFRFTNYYIPPLRGEQTLGVTIDLKDAYIRVDPLQVANGTAPRAITWSLLDTHPADCSSLPGTEVGTQPANWNSDLLHVSSIWAYPKVRLPRQSCIMSAPRAWQILNQNGLTLVHTLPQWAHPDTLTGTQWAHPDTLTGARWVHPDTLTGT